VFQQLIDAEADVPELAFAILREFITSMADSDAVSFRKTDV